MSRSYPLILAFVIAAAAVAAPSARAQSSTPAAQGSSRDDWQFTFTPYGMGANMRGDVGIAGREVSIGDSTSEDVWHFQFGALAMIAARKGNWGFGGDFIWMSLGATTSRPPANIDTNQGAFAFYGLRRLNSAAEVTFGVRWNVLQGRIDFKGPLGVTVEETKQWVDPVVGLNLRTPSKGRWHAGVYTEIGGFGAGSDFVWQIFPTGGVDLGKHSAIEFGYRWLDMDYETGEGIHRFKYDVLTQGPTVGLKFKF